MQHILTHDDLQAYLLTHDQYSHPFIFDQFDEHES
jgi:hypothetical protein